MNESEQITVARAWPDYRTVWRWHFYAGIICIPFIVVLSTTGAIYLFKQELESWLDRPYDQLTIEREPATATDQIKAAIASMPGSTFQSYELPQAENNAARVIVNQNGKAIRVYVHPENLQVLKTIPEDERIMRLLFRIHGELLMGNRGSAVVEMAASWAIVMIVTGLFLWWPRGVTRLGGILYPRLKTGRRVFWRDIHSVTGFWISGLVLFLLLSGLPWAKFWGDYLKRVRALTGTAVARQDWTNGSASPASPGMASGSGEHSGHGGGGGWRRRGRATSDIDLSAIDRIVAAVAPMQLPAPVVIAPPEQGSSDWTAKSMTANRPLRVDLVVDGATAAIKSRKDFHDKHWIDKMVGTGIAAHEGRLFGWPNQLLGLLAATGLITLSVSSGILWWRRREPGTLGAPKPLSSPKLSLSFLAVVMLFGLYLPLFGISLLTVLLLEMLIFRRIPKLRDWLGLRSPAPRMPNGEAAI